MEQLNWVMEQLNWVMEWLSWVMEWPSWVMEYSCWSHLVFARANIASHERVAATLDCWVKVTASRRWWYSASSVIAAGNSKNRHTVSDWK